MRKTRLIFKHVCQTGQYATFSEKITDTKIAIICFCLEEVNDSLNPDSCCNTFKQRIHPRGGSYQGGLFFRLHFFKLIYHDQQLQTVLFTTAYCLGMQFNTQHSTV